MLDRAYGHQWTGDLKTEKLKSVMNWVLECIKESDCLTIFDIRREIHMDKKILSALLKGHDMRLLYNYTNFLFTFLKKKYSCLLTFFLY